MRWRAPGRLEAALGAALQGAAAASSKPRTDSAMEPVHEAAPPPRLGDAASILADVARTARGDGPSKAADLESRTPSALATDPARPGAG